MTSVHHISFARFALDADGSISSVVTTTRENQVKKGMLFTLTRDVELRGHGVLPAGQLWRVFEACSQTGDVGIENEHGDYLVLMPFEVDTELLSAMQFRYHAIFINSKGNRPCLLCSALGQLSA